MRSRVKGHTPYPASLRKAAIVSVLTSVLDGDVLVVLIYLNLVPDLGPSPMVALGIGTVTVVLHFFIVLSV